MLPETPSKPLGPVKLHNGLWKALTTLEAEAHGDWDVYSNSDEDDKCNLNIRKYSIYKTSTPACLCDQPPTSATILG